MLAAAAYIFRARVLLNDEALGTEMGGAVDRRTVRTLLTILMYVGVCIFLLPYFTGKAATASLLMLLGAIIAVVCGLLRCYMTEGD
jgi:hypothetical protein